MDTILSCFNQNLCCSLGYRIPSIDRNTIDCKDYTPELGDWNACLHIKNISYLPNNETNVISLTIRIHLCNILNGESLLDSKISTKSIIADDLHIMQWDENLKLWKSLHEVLVPNAILFFEIIDEIPSKSTNKQLEKSIGWSFLLPVAENGRYYFPTSQISEIESSLNTPTPINWIRLQVFKYCKESLIENIQRELFIEKDISHGHNDGSKREIPRVYYQWRRQDRSPMRECWLNIGLGYEKKTLRPSTLSEPTSQKPNVEDKKLQEKLEKAKRQRLRSKEYPCLIPNRVLMNFSTGRFGAFLVKFSKSGHLLAIVSPSGKYFRPSDNHAFYSLRLFNIFWGKQVASIEIAHHGVIYALNWSNDDQYLLTCSADGTIKVWDVSTYLKQEEEKIISSETEIVLLHNYVIGSNIQVYDAIFQEQPNMNDRKYKDIPSRNGKVIPRVLSASSDGIIRVWKGDEEYEIIKGKRGEDKIHNESKIQSLTIDYRTYYLYSGDSYGNLEFYRWIKSKETNDFIYEIDRFNIKQSKESENVKSIKGYISLDSFSYLKTTNILRLQYNPNSLSIHNTRDHQYLISKGFNPSNSVNPIFHKASFSSDGRYIVSNLSKPLKGGMDEWNDNDKATYHIGIWDTNTKSNNEMEMTSCSLSDMKFIYPIRSISWHPNQHVIAIASIGEGAKVVLYYAKNEDDKTYDDLVNNYITTNPMH